VYLNINIENVFKQKFKDQSYIMTYSNFFLRQVMKKTELNILYLIIGVILMSIALILLVQLNGFIFRINTPIYLKELPDASIFFFIFLNMFLSIIFFNAGVTFFLNDGIEKPLSIKRVIFIAIIVFIFIGVFFPGRAYLFFF